MNLVKNQGLKMYAIIKTGGKQYRVEKDTVLDIEKISPTKKDSNEVVFDDVLLLHNGKKAHIGSPKIAGAKVVGEILDEVKEKKLIVFKYKRRKNCRVKKGHRQKSSRVKIISIKEKTATKGEKA